MKNLSLDTGTVSLQFLRRDNHKDYNNLDRICVIHVPKLPDVVDLYTDNYGSKDVAARYVKETNHSEAYRKSTYMLLKLFKDACSLKQLINPQEYSLVTQRIDEILSCNNENVCVWSINDEGLWLTDCGQVLKRTPENAEYFHCPYCGRLLKEAEENTK